jgi:hypothetical protein
MRAPNEIDFWRGFALVTIFINHIPGIYFERFTFRNVSLSDSAELFVFLAGCALRILCRWRGARAASTMAGVPPGSPRLSCLCRAGFRSSIRSHGSLSMSSDS